MVLSDDEIARLLRMPKIVTNPGARSRSQKGSTQVTYDVAGEGARFQLYVRQNERLTNGFSCGLLYISSTGDRVTLTRYNGSDHPHSNALGNRSTMTNSCHIHKATQRYMEAGRKADQFAAPTDRYSDLAGALRSLILDCNVSGLEAVISTQPTLFDHLDD